MEVTKSGLEHLFIKRTSTTPEINFKNGKLNIKGKSLPDNSVEFYKPLLDYLERYSENPLSRTEVNIKLEHFNAYSSKSLLDVFKVFEKIHKTKHDVSINWYYQEDDESIIEAGEDFESIIRVPFKMIAIVD